MNKLINYLKKEKYTLIFEVIVVVIGMILALTADSIREEYKENQKIQEVFRNDKGNLLDAYERIHKEVVSDTMLMSELLAQSAGIHDTINRFFYGELTGEQFKTCASCVFYVLTPVVLDIEFREFRKLSQLPLYTMNRSYFFDLEFTVEDEELFELISEANANIDYYYFIMDKYINDNMEDIDRDIQDNLAYFKQNFEGYYYMNSEVGVNDMDVYQVYYLNMLRARLDLMEVYRSNLVFLMDGAKEFLPVLDLAMAELRDDLSDGT